MKQSAKESVQSAGERIVAEHLGPREGNPLMAQVGRAYETLIAAIDAAIVSATELATQEHDKLKTIPNVTKCC